MDDKLTRGLAYTDKEKTRASGPGTVMHHARIDRDLRERGYTVRMLIQMVEGYGQTASPYLWKEKSADTGYKEDWSSEKAQTRSIARGKTPRTVHYGQKEIAGAETLTTMKGKAGKIPKARWVPFQPEAKIRTGNISYKAIRSALTGGLVAYILLFLCWSLPIGKGRGADWIIWWALEREPAGNTETNGMISIFEIHPLNLN